MNKFKIGDRVKLKHGPHVGKEATIIEKPPPYAVHREGKPTEDWFIAELDSGQELLQPASNLEKLKH